MDRRAQSEGPGGSVQTPNRLQRSGAIALVVMVDRPYFRAARGEDGGLGRAGCQALFDAAEVQRRAERAFAGHPICSAGTQGLGVLGDVLLASDLAG